MANKQIHQLTEEVALDSTFVIPVQKADGSVEAKKTTIESLKEPLGIDFQVENTSNKSTNVLLGTSDTLYPTQKAVKTYVDANSGLPYSFWRAVINSTSVVRVLHDGIGFTSPTISNPFDGVLYVTKTGFFTSLDVNKLEFISSNLDNFGIVYVTLANQNDGVNPNNQFQVNIYDMAGGQTGTPSGNVTVEIRIYN